MVESLEPGDAAVPSSDSVQNATVRLSPSPVGDDGTDAPGSSSHSLRLLIAGSTLGPYRILAKLGEGGMGAVYQARHQHLDKIVALKVLSAAVTNRSDAIARFKREMKAVGKLEHPYIVRAMDAGEVAGLHYLTMEFVEGADLRKLVRDQGPLSVVQACKAIRQAAQALSAAHAAGLVHRDVKPSNLLMTKQGQIKLLDLGLARLAGGAATSSVDLTTVGQAFGTPDYMAPEQWEDTHLADARSDLYALGCTLYYLLTGRAPYGNKTHPSTMNKMTGHLVGPVPDLRTARPDVPAEIAAIFRNLMAKNPAERYQTAAELVEVLTPFWSANGVDTESLAAQLVASFTSDRAAATRAEMQLQLQQVLNGMDPIDREILSLRHFHAMNNAEIATVLELTKSVASHRYIQALKTLKDGLAAIPGFFT